MPAAEFEQFGREVVDWISRYLEHTREYPVAPAIAPGELLDALPAAGPEEGEGMAAILADFERQVVPALNHWNHPRFHGYFSVSASAPGILAEALAAALNTNGMLWKSCPAAVELEQAVLGWLRGWLGLPDTFFGEIFDTASLSTLHAAAAARVALDPGVRERGAAPDMVLYCSEHAHSSVEKAAMSLGMGLANVRKIAVDERFRLRPEALEAAIQADRAAGLRPCIAVSTVGTTSVASIDPVPAVSAIAARHGLWHHVDGAYAGPAALSEEHRHILDGAAQADSLVVNPHKWLFTPIDCSVFYCRRPEVLRASFSLVPEYLRSAEDPRAVNLMEYGIALGRRFRALKLWFVMRYFGRRRIAEILRAHIAWANEFAGWVEADPRFELAAPVSLSLVCFRLREGDEATRALMDAVNAGGYAFLSGNLLNGRFVIRFAVGNLGTSRADIAGLWERLQAAPIGRPLEPPAEPLRGQA
jgi:aromatic-L-amino-acid decarboxylase